MPTPSRRERSGSVLAAARLAFLVWAAVGALTLVDALVANPIGIGILYFVPLSLAAVCLRRSHTLAMALMCGLERVLFGPAGDPLGLAAINYTLPSRAAALIHGGAALAGYLGAALVLEQLVRQRRTIQHMRRDVDLDPLTGLANRRALERFVGGLTPDRPVAWLALDVDHFKRINDTHGHDAGDRVLRELSRRLSGAVREGDLVARTGGEELVVLLVGAAEPLGRQVAERIRAGVAAEPFDVGEVSLPVTISIGLATGGAPAKLAAEADRALYRAKSLGRNRVEVGGG